MIGHRTSWPDPGVLELDWCILKLKAFRPCKKTSHSCSRSTSPELPCSKSGASPGSRAQKSAVTFIVQPQKKQVIRLSQPLTVASSSSPLFATNITVIIMIIIITIISIAISITSPSPLPSQERRQSHRDRHHRHYHHRDLHHHGNGMISCNCDRVCNTWNFNHADKDCLDVQQFNTAVQEHLASLAASEVSRINAQCLEELDRSKWLHAFLLLWILVSFIGISITESRPAFEQQRRVVQSAT